MPARLVRGETLSLRVREYVQAARVMGGTAGARSCATSSRTRSERSSCNATFQVADAILLLAALSYLGLGVPPPATDWGGMLSNGINYIFPGYWWLIYPPGLAIVRSWWRSTSSATPCGTRRGPAAAAVRSGRCWRSGT